MKKLILIIISLLLVVGCDSIMNNPTKRVEAFLNKYQTNDEEVLKQLDVTLQNDQTLNENQKESYKDLMKKQYKSLSYTIKDEEIDGDEAIVKVEIEVFDFNKANIDAEQYLLEHQDEFIGEDNIVDDVKFMDYKIKLMQNTMEKVKYTLEFNVTKEKGKWKLNQVDETTRQKIHGIYSY